MSSLENKIKDMTIEELRVDLERMKMEVLPLMIQKAKIDRLIKIEKAKIEKLIGRKEN